MRAASILIVVLTGILAGCADGPKLVGVGAELVEARPLPGSARHGIYVVTTREPSPDPAEFFGGERSAAAHYAAATVVVPPEREPGSLSLPKSGPPDPRTDFIIAEPRRFASRASFRSAIDAAFARRAPENRRLLIFVHGYNTTISAAIARLGQFVEDTGYAGVPLLFSWPSDGRTVAYVQDINSAVAARSDLAALKFLVDGSQVQAFDVVAHSMGNLLVMETMRSLALRGEFRDLDKLGMVILAAPDIDLDLFEDQISAVPPGRRNFTVLISRDDRALAVSRRLAGGIPRVGHAPPERLADLGVNVIDLSEVDDPTSLHHDKFASAPDVVRLIGSAFRKYGGMTTVSERSPLADFAGNVVDVITLAPR